MTPRVRGTTFMGGAGGWPSEPPPEKIIDNFVLKCVFSLNSIYRCAFKVRDTPPSSSGSAPWSSIPWSESNEGTVETGYYVWPFADSEFNNLPSDKDLGTWEVEFWDKQSETWVKQSSPWTLFRYFSGSTLVAFTSWEDFDYEMIQNWNNYIFFVMPADQKVRLSRPVVTMRIWVDAFGLQDRTLSTHFAEIGSTITISAPEYDEAELNDGGWIYIQTFRFVKWYVSKFSSNILSPNSTTTQVIVPDPFPYSGFAIWSVYEFVSQRPK